MKSEPVLTVPFIPQLHPDARDKAGRTAPDRRGALRRAWGGTAVLAILSAAVPMIALGEPTGEPTPPSKVPAKAASSTRLSGVTVTATRAIPHVQSTFPAADAKVPPGLLVLRVTYDTKMRPDGWSYARETGKDYPDCAQSPRLLDDGRSFVLICRTLPQKTYSVWFNRPPLDDFASLSRRPADPFELKFSTTDDDPVRTLADAIKADAALSKVSNPVEPDGLAIYGQEREAPGAE